ncbi:hypothetical protein MSG28_001114 [Choristoneura fumiferana]|uniref:Uncharacterized protein n=1 Tax=Choristoneura fumiferana TaxID=7141 RepID=A0ACC0K3N6_CHOFU|nr:hypothetical protein MSG28_001114 [Choristoneura fumiferana]
MCSNLELRVEAGPSTGPQLSVLNDVISPELLARTVPTIEQVNINQSTGVHIGPKFEIVTVTQIVECSEPNRANRHPPDRDKKKKNKIWIRFCWAGIILALLITIALLIHLIIIAKTTESLLPPEAPWRVTREMWDAIFAPSNRTLDEYSPIRLVVIHHTVSPECFDFDSCAAAMRNLQEYFLTMSFLGYDLPYNFVIGNDGRVYDSLLWNREGMHTRLYNKCSIGIAFMGDYRENIQGFSRVTERQISRLHMLLQEGVDLGHLRPDYSIVGAMDLAPTISPGGILYNAIRSLPQYDRTDFRTLTCDEI